MRQGGLADAGLQPQGAVGDAEGASAARGQALLQADGQALARLLAEIDRLPSGTRVNSAVRR